MKTLQFKILFLSIICIFFISCQTPIATVKPINNTTYEVDYLFEHDGCKVYRFYDGGNYVYFTNCNSDITSIQNDSTARRSVTISRRNINAN